MSPRRGENEPENLSIQPLIRSLAGFDLTYLVVGECKMTNFIIS
jgi:hypothetical protein